MQANNTNPTAAPTLADMLAAMPAAERQAALVAAMATLAPADNRTPAQVAADSMPNGVPGRAVGLAGVPATEPLFNYATSALVAGRTYRGNAAGLYNGLRGLVAATADGLPATYQAVQAASKAMGVPRATADSAWCATRDLADLGMAMAAAVGARKGHKPTASGLAHLALCLAATAHHKRPVWVCPFGAVAVCAATGADLGAWPLAVAADPATDPTGTADPAPQPTATASNAYSAALLATAATDPAPAPAAKPASKPKKGAK